MTADLLHLTIINFGIIILKGLLLVGFLVILDSVVWPDVDFSEQVKQGNIAAALVVVGVMLALAIGSGLGR